MDALGMGDVQPEDVVSDPATEPGPARLTVSSESEDVQVGPGPVRAGRSVPELAALCVVLIGLVVYFSVASEFFLATNNIINILTAIAVTGILAAPGTMLLIAGQVDLSVGAVTALCGVVLAPSPPMSASLSPWCSPCWQASPWAWSTERSSRSSASTA